MAFSRVKPEGFVDDSDTITASEMNTIDINQSRAIDGLGGGTYLPLSPITIQGEEGIIYDCRGDGKQIRLSDRQIIRMQELYATPQDPNVWVVFPGMQWSNLIDVFSYLFFPLDIPHDQRIQEIHIWYRGFTGHANDPVDFGGAIVMPHVELVEIDDDGSVTVLASVDDPTTARAQYETWHPIILPVNLAINRENKRHVVRFLSEQGADYISGAEISNVQMVMIISAYVEY